MQENMFNDKPKFLDTITIQGSSQEWALGYGNMRCNIEFSTHSSEKENPNFQLEFGERMMTQYSGLNKTDVLKFWLDMKKWPTFEGCV